MHRSQIPTAGHIPVNVIINAKMTQVQVAFVYEQRGSGVVVDNNKFKLIK